MKNGTYLGLTLFVALNVFMLTGNTLAGPVPDTGQTKCYDGYEDEINPCPSPGEDFYGQDANYAPCNPQSYTKLDEFVYDLPDDTPWPWMMVRDNNTGLIWEVKTDDRGSIHFKYDSYNWQGAQDVFITDLNANNFGGFSDWRMPTVKELSTIVDSSIPYSAGPTINTDYFPNTKSSVSSGYWSSTTGIHYPDYGWAVSFEYGSVRCYDKSGYYLYVRAVRGGQWESNNFIDNGNGTVTDTDADLMWQKDSAPGTYAWQEALSYCESSTLAGYSDWRLPNRNELHSIVDYNRYDPAIDPIFDAGSFPYSSLYWSSTTDAIGPYGAWCLEVDGWMRSYGKAYSNMGVRAVRGGQCGSSDSSTTTTVSGSTTSTISGSTTTTVQPCPTETLYGEHSEKTELLRSIRDNVLSKSLEGKELIKLYYQWSPAIVKAMGEDEEFREEVKEVIDEVLLLME